MLSTGSSVPVSPTALSNVAPRVLVACEDSVLVNAMTRILGWMRPRWSIEAAIGIDAVRRALTERAFDIIACGIEPRAACGGEMLHYARIKHPNVVRVAYRTTKNCQGPEFGYAHEVVSWPSDVSAFIQALDRAMRRVERGRSSELETPNSANLQVV